MSLKTDQRDAMAREIQQHGQRLISLFKLPAKTDPVKLCKRLRRLETRANFLACGLSNGPCYPGFEQATGEALDEILDQVDAILHFRKGNVPVFINRDPRGYALKIHSEYLDPFSGLFFRDWGGYGIIAPDFRQYSS